MVVREVEAGSVLSRSGIEGIDYCVNPYTGCAHSCSYCYASFMKRFTGHHEAWGSFVDAKINAPLVLAKQIRRAPEGTIMLSSVTDPYQPAEVKYRLTRECLKVLSGLRFPVDILTKSPLVLRDLDLLQSFSNVSVGITITTDNDSVRKIFEPKAPPIAERIKAIQTLHEKGIGTYVFVGPVLPMTPEVLVEKVGRHADSLLIDGMNYPSKTTALYRKNKIDEWLDRDFVEHIMGRLKKAFGAKEVIFC